MDRNIKIKDNLSRNAAIYTVGNLFNKAILVLSSPVFTRLLSTNEYGQVTVYITWLGIFTVFTGLELGGSLTNAYYDYGEKNYRAYAKTCISLSMLATLVIILAVVLFQERMEKVFNLDYSLVLLAFLHSFFNNNIMYLSQYLSLLRKAVPYVLISIGQSALNILFSLAAIIYSDWNPALSRIYGQFFASALFGILITVFFLCNKEKILNFKYLKYGLLLSVPLMFHMLGGLILSGSDKLMLSRIADDSVTGLYGFAVSVVTIINAVSISFNTAWMPYLYEMLKKRQIKILQKRTEQYLSCFTFLSCGFMLVMPEMVKVLADKAYWDCIPLVIPLVIGEYFRFLYFFPANYEFYHKQNQWIATSTMLTGIINIGLNLLWIPFLGMYGAALSTVISYVLCFVFHEAVARGRIGNFYVKVKIYVINTFILCMTAITSWIFLQCGAVRWIAACVYAGILLRRILRDKKLF